MGGYGGIGVAAPSVLKSVRRVFTDAEVKALPSAGVIQMLAGQAGVAYLIHAVAFALAPKLASYTNMGANPQIKVYCIPGFSNTFNGAGAILDSSGSLLVGRADALYGIDYAFTAWSGFVGQPINFSFTNSAAGDFTGGDAANRFVVTVFYLELSTG